MVYANVADSGPGWGVSWAPLRAENWPVQEGVERQPQSRQQYLTVINPRLGALRLHISTLPQTDQNECFCETRARFEQVRKEQK